MTVASVGVRFGGWLLLVLALARLAAAASGPSPIPAGFQVLGGREAPADWRAPQSAGFTIVNPADGAQLCWIPPGQFLMGSRAAEQQWARADGAQSAWVDTESPQHRVQLSGFWMYRHEVTNAQFRKFRPAHDSGEYDGVSVNADSHPVVQVSWEDAAAYCRWAGAALPSEAQWEYACRAGTTTMFPWGNDPLAAARYANLADRRAREVWPFWRCVDVDDGYVASAPVGSYLPNGFGLYDMIGNVWEWCQDWFAADYYATSPAVDPPGPGGGSERMVRGASWDNWMGNSRAAYRLRYPPTEMSAYLGFRAVVPAAVRVTEE